MRDFCSYDPRLLGIAAAWDAIPELVRTCVWALIQATDKQPDGSKFIFVIFPVAASGSWA